MSDKSESKILEQTALVLCETAKRILIECDKSDPLDGFKSHTLFVMVRNGKKFFLTFEECLPEKG